MRSACGWTPPKKRSKVKQNKKLMEKRWLGKKKKAKRISRDSTCIVNSKHAQKKTVYTTTCGFLEFLLDFEGHVHTHTHSQRVPPRLVGGAPFSVGWKAIEDQRLEE